MLFFLRYALVRLLPRLPHEERHERQEAAPRPVAFVVLCSSLHRRRRWRILLPVPRFVLIRCYSGVIHHQQTCEIQAHGPRAMIVVLRWILGPGQRQAAALGYLSLPNAVVAMEEDAIGKTHSDMQAFVKG